MSGPGQTRAYATLVLIVSIWASYPAVAKVALRDFPPFFLAAVRCSLASAFLVWLVLRQGGESSSNNRPLRARLLPRTESVRSLTPGALRAFLFLGVTGYWMSTQFSYLGYYYTTAANAVILQAATPVMVALGARFYLGERLLPMQRVGTAVSVLGVLVLITNGRLAMLRIEELRAGDIITIAALTGWAAYTVYGKRVVGDYSPGLATAGAYVLGTLLMIPTAVATAPLFPPPRLGSAFAWGVVCYQAIIGALAHVWWYQAVQSVGPSVSAIFINLQPVVGVALAWLIVGESIGRWQVIGGLLVVGGVVLTTVAPKRQDVRQPPTSGRGGR